MAQKPSVQGLEREVPEESVRLTRGADAGSETIGGIAARFYEEHLVLWRQVTHLREEVEKLRQDRLDLEEKIDDQSEEASDRSHRPLAGGIVPRPTAGDAGPRRGGELVQLADDRDVGDRVVVLAGDPHSARMEPQAADREPEAVQEPHLLDRSTPDVRARLRALR